ncbi:MAG: flavodoxin family protein [Vallitalea sp.]|nr:flavodoxin family protein [Vallitalea sp.]
MKLLVSYSSLTGNTQKLATAIYNELSLNPLVTEIDLISVKESINIDDYDCIFHGFWVSRETADPLSKKFLENINNKKIALFATLGAYADSPHAKRSMDKAQLLLDESNCLLPTFICRGKIDPKLTERRRKKYPIGHPKALTPEREANHISSRKHPNEEDLTNGRNWASMVLNEVEDTVS